MRRQGLRRETAELDKKIWDWSLTVPSVTKNEIQNYAKNLFNEAGFENFKASDCWYRRWRCRWRNPPSNKQADCSNQPSNTKQLNQPGNKNEIANKTKKKNFKVKESLKYSKYHKPTEITTAISKEAAEDNSQIIENIHTQGETEDNIIILKTKDSDKSLQNSPGPSLETYNFNSSTTMQIHNINSKTNRLEQLNNIGDQSLEIDEVIETNATKSFQTLLESNRIQETQKNDLVDSSSHLCKMNEVATDLNSISSTSLLLEVIEDHVLNDFSTRTSSSKMKISCDTKNNVEDNESQVIDKGIVAEVKKIVVSPLCSQSKQDGDNMNIFNCLQHQNSMQISEDINKMSEDTVLNCFSTDTSSLKIDGASCNTAPICKSFELEDIGDRTNSFSTQLVGFSNCDSFCVINNSGRDVINGENVNFEVDVVNTNSSNPFDEVSSGTSSLFSNFLVPNSEEATSHAEKTSETPTELKSVGSDSCFKDQHSLELMRVIRSNLSRGSESCPGGNNNDNLDTCLISNEFQISGLSLNSDEIFESSLFLDTNDIFCENCDDFHVKEVGCDATIMNVMSLPNSVASINHSELDEGVFDCDLPVNDAGLRKDPSSKDEGALVSESDSGAGNSQPVQRQRKKGERYLPKFKAKVVAFRKTHTNRETVSKFNVSESTVDEWIHANLRKTKTQDFESFKESKINQSNVESKFLNWLNKMQEDKQLLTQEIISKKLEDLLKVYGNQGKCQEKWIQQYFERLQSQETGISGKVSSSKAISKKYIMYPMPFKKLVAIYAKSYNQASAARVFMVSRKRVQEWMQIFKDNQGQDVSKVDSQGSIMFRRADVSNYVTDDEIDRNIMEWYEKQSVPPTAKQVRDKGRELYAAKGYDIGCSFGWLRRWRLRHKVMEPTPMTSVYDQILEWILGELDRNVKVSHADLLDHVTKERSKTAVSFKVSSGWGIRFCKRFTSLLQKTPKFDTNLPPAMEMKVLNFRKHIQNMMQEFAITDECIGTIDEIPICFTDTGVKLKEQLIRRAGFDHCQASLVISCLSNGRLLPSIIIMKGNMSQDLILSNEDVLDFIRENGSLDPGIMVHWIRNVWLPSQSGNPSILVTNHFEPYKDTTVIRELSAASCEHELFPPGCLSKLQPIRVALSKSFQDGLHDFWKKRVETLSWGEDMSSISFPSHHDMFDWTTQLHRKLANTFQEEIKDSFKKTLFAKDE